MVREPLYRPLVLVVENADVLLSFELLLYAATFALRETAQELVPLEAAHVEHGEGNLLVRSAHETVLHLDLIGDANQVEEIAVWRDVSSSHDPRVYSLRGQAIERISEREGCAKGLRRSSLRVMPRSVAICSRAMISTACSPKAAAPRSSPLLASSQILI